jgi:hypothetical protein
MTRYVGCFRWLHCSFQLCSSCRRHPWLERTSRHIPSGRLRIDDRGSTLAPARVSTPTSSQHLRPGQPRMKSRLFLRAIWQGKDLRLCDLLFFGSTQPQLPRLTNWPARECQSELALPPWHRQARSSPSSGSLGPGFHGLAGASDQRGQGQGDGALALPISGGLRG